MKVLALIYGDESRWESLTPEDREAVYTQHRAFAAVAGAKLVSGAELAPTEAATTVRVRDGQTLITDGPFAETKEQLGGFYLLECADLDDAAALAAQIPSDGPIELRAAHEEDEAA
jgi:hypothetical protein